MRLKLAYKFIFSLLLIITFACSKIDRDNILDPKNPSSKEESVVVLEAFINTSDLITMPYIDYALDAIDVLKDTYQERLIILEYHRNLENPIFDDDFTFSLNEGLYTQYTSSYSSSRNKGVPDIFINGAEERVQGASTSSNVINRVQGIIENQLLNIGEYTIEVDFSYLNNTIDGTYRIAPLGDKSSKDGTLRILASSDLGGNGKSTVLAFETKPITKIAAGEFLEESFSLESVSNANHLVIVLMEATTVLHAIEKEIL